MDGLWKTLRYRRAVEEADEESVEEEEEKRRVSAVAGGLQSVDRHWRCSILGSEKALAVAAAAALS